MFAYSESESLQCLSFLPVDSSFNKFKRCLSVHYLTNLEIQTFETYTPCGCLLSEKPRKKSLESYRVMFLLLCGPFCECCEFDLKSARENPVTRLHEYISARCLVYLCRKHLGIGAVLNFGCD